LTSPRTPCAAPIWATQMRSATARYSLLLRGGRGFLGLRHSGGLFGLLRLRLFFGPRLALLAWNRPLRVVVLLALGDTGGVEETHHAIRRLRALHHPGFDLVEVELQTLFLVLRQQRIVEAEALDEAAV